MEILDKVMWCGREIDAAAGLNQFLSVYTFSAIELDTTNNANVRAWMDALAFMSNISIRDTAPSNIEIEAARAFLQDWFDEHWEELKRR